MILQSLESAPLGLSSADLCLLLSCEKAQLKTQLDLLIADGKVVKTGRGKGTRYQIPEAEGVKPKKVSFETVLLAWKHSLLSRTPTPIDEVVKHFCGESKLSTLVVLEKLREEIQAGNIQRDFRKNYEGRNVRFVWSE
jgi:hypothetical protein